MEACPIPTAVCLGCRLRRLVRALGNAWQSLPFVLLENAKLLVGWVAFYLLGFYLRPQKWFVPALTVCVVAMVIAVPFLVQTDPFSSLDEDRRRFGGEVASYQYFANAVAFVVLTAAAYSRDARVQGALLGIGWIAVFLIGSRSETAGMIFVIVLWGALQWTRSRRLSWKPIGAILVGFVAAVGLGVFLQADAITRYVDAGDLANSSSWNQRLAGLVEGLEDIRKSPILGEYAGQMAGMPVENAEQQSLAFTQYMHNALSLWREHGLMPFLLLAGMSFYACFLGIRATLVERKDSSMAKLLLFVSVYTLLLAAATKTVYWPMPALAWGMASAWGSREHKDKETASSVGV